MVIDVNQLTEIFKEIGYEFLEYEYDCFMFGEPEPFFEDEEEKHYYVMIVPNITDMLVVEKAVYISTDDDFSFEDYTPFTDKELEYLDLKDFNISYEQMKVTKQHISDWF